MDRALGAEEGAEAEEPAETRPSNLPLMKLSRLAAGERGNLCCDNIPLLPVAPRGVVVAEDRGVGAPRESSVEA